MKSDEQVQREWTVIDTIRQRKLQLFGISAECQMTESASHWCLGWWKGKDDDKDDLMEMDRRHSDVMRSRRSKSTDDDRAQRQLEEIRS